MMPHPRSGLWWLAILILIAGGAIAYTLTLDPAAQDGSRRAMLVLSISIALSGICVISATAGWWMKR
jgi:predicted membrane channel-forming protein YqfA (hemolysin III family)